MWRRNGAVGLVLALALVLGGCPKSGVGIGIKTGEINKQVVEATYSEVVRMYCGEATDAEMAALKAAGKECVRKISKTNYDRAKDAYGKYEITQRSYADALIAWTRVKSAANDRKVETALQQLREQATNTVAITCSFKDLSSSLATLCAQAGS